METPEIIQRVRVRMALQRGLLLWAQVSIAALSLVMIPLFVSRWQPISSGDEQTLFAFTTLCLALAVWAALFWTCRPTSRDAACLIDQTSESGQLFLTSLDQTATQRSSVFAEAFNKRLQDSCARINTKDMVPLDSVRTPFRALLILTAALGGVALVPGATVEREASVRRVQDYLKTRTEAVTLSKPAAEAVRQLSQDDTPDKVQERAAQLWRKEGFLTEREAEERLGRLEAALRTGDAEAIRDALAESDVANALHQASPSFRSRLAALMAAANSITGHDRAASALSNGNSAQAVRAIGGAGVPTDTAGTNTAPSHKEKLNRSDELRRILMTVFAQLNAAPPSSEGTPSTTGKESIPSLTTEGAAWHFNPDRFAQKDRRILKGYFERHRWTTREK